jgi:hypothetical protein
MKWVKRILMLTLTLVALLLIGGFVGYRLLHERPQWYGQIALDAGQREEAASAVEDTLVNASNWSAETQVRRAQGQPATSADDALELSFAEDQLNAIISKWDELAGSSLPLADVTSPQILLNDGQIVLAGTLKDANIVVSVRLSPRLDEQGHLQVEIAGVTAGRLPLPRAVWGIYARRLAAGVAAQLPGADRRAKMDADGSVNDAMASAVLSRMLLHILQGESAQPVLFISYFQNNRSRDLPVKIRTMRIENKTMTIALAPLPAGEQIDAGK